MISGCLQQYLHAKLGGWGAGGLGHFAAEDLAEYERCWMRQGPAKAAAAGEAAAGEAAAAAAAAGEAGGEGNSAENNAVAASSEPPQQQHSSQGPPAGLTWGTASGSSTTPSAQGCEPALASTAESAPPQNDISLLTICQLAKENMQLVERVNALQDSLNTSSKQLSVPAESAPPQNQVSLQMMCQQLAQENMQLMGRVNVLQDSLNSSSGEQVAVRAESAPPQVQNQASLLMFCQQLQQGNMQLMGKVNALQDSLNSSSGEELSVPHGEDSVCMPSGGQGVGAAAGPAAPGTALARSRPSGHASAPTAATLTARPPAAPAAADAADNEARHVPNAGPLVAGHNPQQQQQQQDVTRLYPSVHSACEDYRASAWNGIDMQHDRLSRAAGQKLRCDVLAVWGERGVVARLFDVERLWRAAASEGVVVRGVVVPGVGHFIPEEAPELTAQLLRDFFK
jgi:hypothetical protein